MGRVLILDGYNIVNAWPDLIKAKDESLETAREKLIDVVVNYAALTGYKVVLVFDGHKMKGNTGSREMCNDVEIVYSKYNETADQVIERMVSLFPSHEVCVVTADEVEQRLIFGRGALRMTPGEFYQEVVNVLARAKLWSKDWDPVATWVFQRVKKETKNGLEKMRRGESPLAKKEDL